ncbi:hypothetical protein TYRP_021005 [Tyrophagus putrescentiae]|nr:hypothetical protein TYRP_021005 [Tyrophagus putrescentiae]
MDKCGGSGEDVRNVPPSTSITFGSDRLDAKQNEVEKKEKKKNEDEIEVIGVVEVVLETAPEQKTSSSREEQKRKSKFFAGILLAICSSVCFALTNVIVKCTVGVSRAQLAVFRYFGIFLMSIPLVLDTGDPLFGPASWWFRLWMLLRGLFGGAALLFKFYALEHISMANTTVIILSTPVFVFLFARLLLGEPFGRYHLLSLVLSLSGIATASKLHLLLISDGGVDNIINNSTIVNKSTSTMTFITITSTVFPTIINSSSVTSMMINSTAVDGGDDNGLINSSGSSSHSLLGNCYALLSTILGAMVFVFIRKVGPTEMSTVHHSIILFNFAWIAMAELLPVCYLSTPEDFVISDFLPIGDHTPYLLFALAVLSFYGQVLMTKAIQLEEAGVVAVVRGSSEAVFSFVLEVTVFGVQPDMYSILGALLVLFSVVLLTVRNTTSQGATSSNSNISGATFGPHHRRNVRNKLYKRKKKQEAKNRKEGEGGVRPALAASPFKIDNRKQVQKNWAKKMVAKEEEKEEEKEEKEEKEEQAKRAKRAKRFSLPPATTASTANNKLMSK